MPIGLQIERPRSRWTVAAHCLDRAVEGSLCDNADLEVQALPSAEFVAAYASRADRPSLPFWPLSFGNIALHLLDSDDLPLDAKRSAAIDLTAAADDGAPPIPIGEPLPLDEVAEAHDRVDSGARGRVLLALPYEFILLAPSPTPPGRDHRVHGGSPEFRNGFELRL